MRKLKLDLETLAVEKFATTKVVEEVGTVRGHATGYSDCYCPHTYLDQGCYSISDGDDCVCVITTKLNHYTCYPGCI